MQYKKAPISEVIFGATFTKSIADSMQIISYGVDKLKSDFPFFELSVPIADNIEHNNGYLEPKIDPLVTGQAVNRFMSTDRHLLIQIQKNKFYFNWIRKDEELTGKYPGFNTLFPLFQKYLNEFIETFKINKTNEIKYLDLSYHNRFKMENSKIQDFLQFSLYSINDNIDNFSYKFNDKIPELKAYSNTTIETVYNLEKQKLFRLECVIQSENLKIKEYWEWYQKVHEVQISFFKKTFNENKLKEWQ